MLAFIDKRVNPIIKKNLHKYFEVIDFETKNITYNTISCHPDIFFFKFQNQIFIPYNLPIKYHKILENTFYNISILDIEINDKYPKSASLNIATNTKYFIHNLKITPKILLSYSNYNYVNVKQGYCRCSTIPLDEIFITSDKGIENKLKKIGLPVYYVDNNNIILEGYDKGFIGGTCGIFGKKIFFMGSLKHYNWGDEIRIILESYHYDIIELYDGPLIDAGTIFIL